MPQIADSVTEGVLQKYNKRTFAHVLMFSHGTLADPAVSTTEVGDAVAEDEIIAVFETDKVAYDFQAKASGVITKVKSVQLVLLLFVF
jgi:pyruvate/2-oxoglutarate dehydrogenase complex dihydrolipoamide acyltransferase (E2) component